MAWNEPGGGKRDPWQGKPRPPDMDALLRRIRDGFSRFLGSGGSGSAALLIVILVVLWIAMTSWAKIDAREIGVVLRFGQFNRLMSSGLNMKLPTPIEQVIPVKVTDVRQVSDEVRMLTKDENIVQIDFNVQYTIADARQYLFGANAPEETLKQAAESSLRQVIGHNDMDTILSGRGTDLDGETEKQLQQTIDTYHVGLLVKKVNFQKILPPTEVKEAFDDANNAGNNQQQYINDALAYSAKIIPVARGDAARTRAKAEGYKAEQIANATGDTERFTLIEAQYKSAPDVTRKRLFLETMQTVLGNNTKVIDGTNGKNLLYLPIDKTKIDPDVNAAAAAELRKAREGGQ